MEISLTRAKAQLTDLVHRAEAGEDILLTRHGQPAARIVPCKSPRLKAEEIDTIVREIQAAAAGRMTPGPCAARSQDFLYDENGMPA